MIILCEFASWKEPEVENLILFCKNRVISDFISFRHQLAKLFLYKVEGIVLEINLIEEFDFYNIFI